MCVLGYGGALGILHDLSKKNGLATPVRTMQERNEGKTLWWGLPFVRLYK